MTTHHHRISLLDDDGDGFNVSVMTPKGAFNLRGSISDKDGAFVLYIDTDENEPALEATPNVLRVNVNDGPVFNYDDAVNWYGEDQGTPAPELANDEDEAVRCRWCGQEIGIIHYGDGDRWQPTPALGDDLCEVRAELATDDGIYRHEPEA